MFIHDIVFQKNISLSDMIPVFEERVRALIKIWSGAIDHSTEPTTDVEVQANLMRLVSLSVLAPFLKFLNSMF